MPLKFRRGKSQPDTVLLEHAARCPAEFNGGQCGSAVFYDWGLELLESRPSPSVLGGEIERFANFTQTGYRIKICSRCTTPYILEAGDLIDISDELGAEEVREIIARGQTSLPHPKIKDP